MVEYMFPAIRISILKRFIMDTEKHDTEYFDQSVTLLTKQSEKNVNYVRCFDYLHHIAICLPLFVFVFF
jgi:hypothetical protein